MSRPAKKWKIQRQLSLGYDASGKYRRTTIRANSEVEYARKATERQRKFDAENKASEITVEKLIDRWKETKDLRNPNTEEMYKYSLKKIESLYGMKAKNVTADILQNVLNQYSGHDNTCIKLRMTIKEIFKYAAINDYIIKDPSLNLIIPTVKSSTSEVTDNTKSEGRRPLSNTEIASLSQIDWSPKERCGIILLYNCGVRPEELIALTKKDILPIIKINVDKAIVSGKEKIYPKDTKNGKHRKIPISLEVYQELKAYADTINTEHLICNDDGTLFSKNNLDSFRKSIQHQINEYLGGKSSGTECLNGLTLYTFRHNFASSLLHATDENGKPLTISYCAYLLGDTVKTFMQTYAHIIEERENDVVVTGAFKPI